MVTPCLVDSKYSMTIKVAWEALWLRRILEDLGQKQEDHMVIYYDNILLIAIS